MKWDIAIHIKKQVKRQNDSWLNFTQGEISAKIHQHNYRHHLLRFSTTLLGRCFSIAKSEIFAR